MIFILDNYDSFTYNLVQAVAALGTTVEVERNDRISAAEILLLEPDGVILSPGPGRPETSGRMPQIFAELVGRVPVLGVCLGMQMIAHHFGGRIIPAKSLVHGKAGRMIHDGRSIFQGLPNPLAAGRYHSLAVEAASLPDCLEVSCRADDGEIMGIRHRRLAIEGVQFHPESILTPDGSKLISNFLSFTKRKTFSIEHADARN